MNVKKKHLRHVRHRVALTQWSINFQYSGNSFYHGKLSGPQGGEMTLVSSKGAFPPELMEDIMKAVKRHAPKAEILTRKLGDEYE